MRVGKKVLAVTILIALSVLPATVPPANAGGLPVIDGSNLTQNIMTAIESVAQTLKQIEQYKRNCSNTKTCCRTRSRPRHISGIRR